jgi:hypothetical protein
MKTVFCKGCNKLEQTDRAINPLNCSKRIVDGIEYLACYLHPAANPVQYAYPAYAFNNEGAAHAFLKSKAEGKE